MMRQLIEWRSLNPLHLTLLQYEAVSVQGMPRTDIRSCQRPKECPKLQNAAKRCEEVLLTHILILIRDVGDVCGNQKLTSHSKDALPC